MREADLEKHLNNGQTERKGRSPRKGPRGSPQAPGREAKKSVAERKLPEFGTDKDFQLAQALNQLRGKPVLVSKTQTERKGRRRKRSRPSPALPHRAGCIPALYCPSHPTP